MRLEDYQPGPPAEVSTKVEDGVTSLVFVREFRHPPHKVWAALTQKDKQAKWAPYAFEQDLSATGSVVVNIIDGSTPDAIQSEVLRLVPDKLLEFTWTEGHSLLWELEETDSGTRLMLTHTVPESDEPMIDLFASGWHICMDLVELLIQDYIIGPIVGELAWKYVEMVRDHYREALNMGPREED